MQNFALIGAAGYIAPRHMKAIAETGNRLVAALDPHDSVGILDRHFPDALFFTEYERFDRFLEKRRRHAPDDAINYVSICSPNYLHDAHVRTALRAHANAVCEKPLVINPWNLEALQEIEAETGKRVYTVLQLRLHPALVALKERLDARPANSRANVCLTYITRRGHWYDISWKGSTEKSGGMLMNIGIHFFDICLWLFGHAEEVEVHLSEPRRAAGVLELERARVQWFLSIEANDLPESFQEQERAAFRSLMIDGEEVEFSEGFADLHTEVYRQILSGKGLGIRDAQPSVQLVYDLRHKAVSPPGDLGHPYLKGVS